VQYVTQVLARIPGNLIKSPARWAAGVTPAPSEKSKEKERNYAQRIFSKGLIFQTGREQNTVLGILRLIRRMDHWVQGSPLPLTA
jgi:hypothetical protein